MGSVFSDIRIFYPKTGLESNVTLALSHEIPQYYLKYTHITQEKGHFAPGNTVPLNSTYFQKNAVFVFAGCAIYRGEGKYQEHAGDPGATSCFEILCL